MAGKRSAPDDHDNPWKEALVGAFPEFMVFYFPEAHAGIDWARGHTFLDKELRQVVRDAASGKRLGDVLVRVTGVDANPQLLYVHVEVQTQRDEAFARRMFTCNHRLLDRWNEPVASFAVLADDSAGWRPSEYRMTVLGCEHVMRFPVAKLLDFEPRLAELPKDPNPFALVTAAHLSALRTRADFDSALDSARLHAAYANYTEQWADRVPDAASLETVFGGDVICRCRSIQLPGFRADREMLAETLRLPFDHS